MNEAAQAAAAKPRHDTAPKVEIEIEAQAENGNSFSGTLLILTLSCKA